MDALDSELLNLANTVRRNQGQPALTAISPSAHLRHDLHFDSLDLAELTVRIEERFGVDVFERGIVHHWSEVQERIARGRTDAT